MSDLPGVVRLLSQVAPAVVVLAVAALLLVVAAGNRPARVFALLLTVRAAGGLAYSLGIASADPTWSAYLWRVTPYFVIATAAAAAYFALVHPELPSTRPWARAAPWAVFAGGVAAAGAYASDHTLFWDLATATGPPQTTAPTGPLFAAYGVFEAAFGLVAWRAWRAVGRGGGGPRAVSLLLVGLGFATVVVFDVVAIALVVPTFLTRHDPPLAAALIVLHGVALGLVVLGAWELRRRTHSIAPTVASKRRAVAVVAAAGATGIALALLPAGWAASLAPTVSGAWRLALPLLAAYGLLKYRLFGIDAKLRFGIAKGTVAAVFVAMFFVASEAAQQFFGEQFNNNYIGIAAAGVLVVAIAPLHRLAERFAHRAVPETAAPAKGDGETHATYRAAVKVALADGTISRSEERALMGLAEELGLTPLAAFEVREEVEAALAGDEPGAP